MESRETEDEQWLRPMKAFYLSRSADKLSQLRQAIDAIEKSPRSHGAYRKLDRLLHNLIGSGGSYGLPEISDQARHMLQRLKLARDSGGLLTPALMPALREDMARLTELFAEAAEE
ncbi:MAG: Hpt domain-containing protein [Armatimonadota bacterium]|nr:Hpt domain-containing protein [Armatimonadota bacterium]